MPSRIRVLDTKEVFRGKIVQLRIEEVIEPGNVKATREVVYHGGSVVILPILADGRVLMVRQFRYPARQMLWELVAGGMEAGEQVAAAARRELEEEAGFRARTVRRLIDFYSSPGFLTERMFLVEARGLTPSRARPEADERITIGRFSAGQLRAMIHQGQIRDGKTLVGLLWFLCKQSSQL